MSTEEFSPTHEVPAGGVDSWTTPDPNAAPDGRLAAGLSVQMLEGTTGWAHVRCDNAWETWVDATLLVPLAAPITGFVPTHQVGSSLLDARDRPDPAHEVAAQLDPALPVVELERWGDWVHVRCENEWEAWVDGRELVAYAGTSSPTGTPTTSSEVHPVATPLQLWLPIAGAALAIIGSFLPWFSAGGASISAWDIRFVGLFTHEPSDLGIDTGLVLLLLALAALPLLTKRPLPRSAMGALGGLAVLSAVLAWLLPDVPDPGIGLFLTLIGGVVMIVPAFMGLGSQRTT